MLTFDIDDVLPLLAHAEAALEHGMGYSGEPPYPGLFLVGDQGIYLMSNGHPGLLKENGKGYVVVYANECDPTRHPFEDWWAVKRQEFGGDDGAEVFSAEEIRQVLACYPAARLLEISLTDTALAITAR